MTKISRRTFGRAAATALLGLAIPFTALAQSDYPNRPIKMIVSFSAGGTTDVTARQVAQRLSTMFKQPVVVENKPGAGGTLGTDYVARQPADGYTLLMTSSGPVAISPSLSKKLATDPLTEIVPVVLVVDVPNVLVVNPSLPVKTFDELVKYGKANAGKVNYASTGVGTVAHLAGALFVDRMGLDATHIPYKGADAVTDLMSGRTQFMFATLPSVISQIRAGKLRAIAIMAAKRSRTLPDVPTLAEVGMKTSGAGAWFGLFVAKGTPEPIIQKLNAAVNEILRDKTVIDAFEGLGAEPVGGTPEEYARKVKSDYEEWKPIVQRSGAASD